MICLGIESTAHTFGISIVDNVNNNCNVLSNVKKLFTTEEGGFIPAEVSDHHHDFFDVLLDQALDEAKLSLKDIDLISFSQSPGMGHSLRIGAVVARSLSLLLDIPLIGVNHCIAHLEIGRKLAKSDGDDFVVCEDPVFLYASGANTQIIAYEGKKYRIFGETLDNGIGNFLDGFARHIGLGFPGGPKIQKLAEKSSNFIYLPYTVKGMDLNFGGLQTKLKQLWNSKNYSKEDLCFSAQETAFAMLLEVSERALAHTGKKELLLGGGVACNTRLQEMAKQMCKDRGAKCFILPNEYNVDNAAMIAWTGLLEYSTVSGQRSDSEKIESRTHDFDISNSEIYPYLRTDDIDITWRKD